jgi:hypothetical protein
MSDPIEDPVWRLHREALERAPASPPQPPAPYTIPYTQLPEGHPDSPTATEWNFYRRTVGRLLTEGHEGKWLLIKGEEIVSIWATLAEADTVRQERFLGQPVLLKQILAQEPILRIGYNRLCRN